MTYYHTEPEALALDDVKLLTIYRRNARILHKGISNRTMTPDVAARMNIVWTECHRRNLIGRGK